MIQTAEPPTFVLERDPFDQLVLIDAEGTRHVDVTPVRLFPYSDPGHWISICDPQRREIVCVPDLTALAEETREVLQTELSRREFVPVITRVYHVSGDSEPCEWDVETDRGRTKFVLTSEDHVRRMELYGAMMIDAHGIRYLIPDLRKLDASSRRVLEQYV